MANKKKLDRDSYFEVLDRAFIVSNLFNQSIGQHKVVKKDKKLEKKCKKIQSLIGDLIQLSGNKLSIIDENNAKLHK